MTDNEILQIRNDVETVVTLLNGNVDNQKIVNFIHCYILPALTNDRKGN